MSTLLLRRRDGTWQGLLRSYTVLVDGETAGKVAYDSEISLPVSPGTHQVRMKIDWCGSPTLSVSVGAGETKVVECGANGSPWTALYYVVWKAQQYLWVKEAKAA